MKILTSLKNCQRIPQKITKDDQRITKDYKRLPKIIYDNQKLRITKDHKRFPKMIKGLLKIRKDFKRTVLTLMMSVPDNQNDDVIS